MGGKCVYQDLEVALDGDVGLRDALIQQEQKVVDLRQLFPGGIPT
jgi:hypothetical protein